MSNWLVFWLALAVVALGFIATARSHDIYHDWKTRSGMSCCHDKDCAPATATPNEDGSWWASQNGKRYFVPKQNVLPIASPDGRSHACVIGEIVVCFVPGEARI